MDDNRLARALRGVVLAALVVAWGATLWRVHDLALHRHFTIDEWQYGHATWLVAQGGVPYRDFYEHHVPLSYLVHAPLFLDDGGFAERALRLRRIVFAWIAALSLLLAATTWRATRDAPLAQLTAFLPLGLGFGLLSLVDYRADNFAACLFLGAMGLLEANREGRRPGLALAAGVLLAAALATTQKMVYQVGGTALVLLALELVRRRVRGGTGPPWVARPGSVALAAAGAGGLALLALLLAGVAREAFTITVLHAVAHEGAHPAVPVARFLAPYLERTSLSSAAVAACVPFAVATRHGRFWLVPLVVAVASGAAIRAQFPYNYVLASLLVGVAALAGFAWLASRVPLPGRTAALRPLLWLLPLLVLPQQLAFVRGTSDNGAQLALLEAVERFSGPDDVVIDGAGAALFRPHASYWWYHGGAHRKILADVFETRLLEDYRASRAPLWIRDMRLRGLPPSVHDYFRRHYTRVDGDLFALGFRLAPGGREPQGFDVDVVRPGLWNVFPAEARPAAGGAHDPWLRVDGRVAGPTVELEAGPHRLTVLPGAPALIATPLPEALFREVRLGDATHSPTFEYGGR